MKKSIILSLITLFCSLAALAGEDTKFEKAMQAAITAVHSSKTVEEMQQAANQLERIATAEPKEWLPAYWVSYSYLNMAFMENDNVRKDQLMDKADQFLQKAEAQQSNQDEVLVMKAFIALGRISIDGQTRFQTYGPIFNESLAKARQINQENPRIYMLEGQMLYYTPEAFGGGKATACPKLKTAMDKFSSFKPASSISPDWGIKSAEHLYANCDGK
ncbi:hypothetical protein GXP67_28835 [Rhodocytophaga rosea]|uniref:Tetratricopeptide repeat protein n=1 Tax=Rhodocytophaga rosea TaxID=2704465 RepID=A0A6C0GR19_9BACT|nr:hypothetical protein [Rhodocytophaga rosea]QHT70377.1 hypothetical protein GXP67_28835 [Rhodocytophaga rosea]